jgi:hypothetical protein
MFLETSGFLQSFRGFKLSATILNTDSNINAKTVMAAENAETVTGLKTYDRDPNPPFAVSSGSAVVPNLDADKLDGIEGAALYKLDGTTTLTAGIPFPAVQVPSAGVNVLDDYEEGTFSPTIISSGGGTPTYTSQVGRYIKIGRLVYVTGIVVLATKGTLAAGNVTIGALPFTSENVSLQFSSAAFSSWTMATPIVYMTGNVSPNTTAINITHLTVAATGLTSTTVADIAATSQFVFTVGYVAAA